MTVKALLSMEATTVSSYPTLSRTQEKCAV